MTTVYLKVRTILFRVKQILILLIASAPVCFAQASPHESVNESSFVEPAFLLPPDPDFNDYRPVLNADATTVIFERNPIASPNDIKLHSADLATMDVQPFVSIPSTRPDWCWNRSGGGLTSGPVAFSNGDGIYTVPTGCTAHCTPTPRTERAGIPAKVPGARRMVVT